MESEVSRYSYEDWWDGKVYHVAGDLHLPAGRKPPKALNWEDFDCDSQSKIKSKQKELFDSNKDSFIHGLQQLFIKKLKTSQRKQEFYKAELIHCEDVLFNRKFFREFDGLVYLAHWGFSIRYDELVKLQHYYKRVITFGNESNFDFVHSPHFLFKNDEHSGQMLAQAIFEYHKWVLEPKNFTVKEKVHYSYKAIAIAYFFMDIKIKKENTKEIMERHSSHKWESRLIAENISRVETLYTIDGNIVTDRRHLKSLIQARQLLTELNHSAAIQDITRVIATFQNSFAAKY